MSDSFDVTQVLDWSVEQGGITVKTDRDTYIADRIVFCAGPWTGKLLKSLGIAIVAARMSFGWVWPLGDFRAYTPEAMPCWCIVDEDGCYYGFPMMTELPIDFLRIGRLLPAGY